MSCFLQKTFRGFLLIRIIIIGAPGSGKGTQAKFIIKKYGIQHISTGDMLRDFAKSSSNFGKKIKKIVNSGKLVTDKLVIEMIKNRIKQNDCRNGFILDGFPRTISQAYSIKIEHINIDYVLNFDVLDEVILDRVVNRLVHVSSGRVYNSKFNAPKVTGIDDVTGENLIIREDDREEIIRQRLLTYHQMATPLINFYKKEAQEGVIKYFKIDASKSVEEVHEELQKIIKE